MRANDGNCTALFMNLHMMAMLRLGNIQGNVQVSAPRGGFWGGGYKVCYTIPTCVEEADSIDGNTEIG